MESDSSSSQATVWATVSQQQPQQQQQQQVQVQQQPAAAVASTSAASASTSAAHQQQQQQQVQPAQFVANTPSSSGNFTVTTTQQALPMLAASQPAGAASVSTAFSAQYVDFRHPQFTTYHINIPQSELYQPAQSSYERISPVDEFRTGEVVSGNEAIATYSALQTADGTQLIAAPTVDSTTLHAQGIQVHHVMLEDQLLTVQRVMSPVDCTVSQSTLSHHQDQDPQHEAAIIPVTHHQQIEAMSVSGEPDTTQEDSQDFNTVQVGSAVTFNSDGDIGGDTTDANGLHSTMAVCSSSSNGISTTTQDVLHVTPGPSVSRAQLASSTVDNVMASDVEVSAAAAAAAGAVLHSVGPSQACVMDSAGQQDQQHQQQHQQHQQQHQQHQQQHQQQQQHLQHLQQHHHQQQQQQQQPLESISIVDSSGAVDHEIQNGQHLVLTNGLGLEAGSSSCTSPGSSNSGNSMDEEKENMPQSSRQLRKSNRIANMEAESTWTNRHRRYYQPKEYNPNELWCEECLTTYPSECPEHRLQIIPDKVVLSRAWSSLPSILQIFRLGESTELGVFAKRYISKSTQFGPFIGEPVANQNMLADSKFILMLEKENNECYYFKTSDENKCNWMMFVRPAENFAEQNLVAYQHGQDIFFTVSKNIEPKQELKVWYACNYAERIGAQVLDITDEDIEVLNEQECEWPCYECNKRFKTSAALQKHLVVHEENAARQQEEDFYAQGEMLIRKHKRKKFSSHSGSSMKKKKRHHKHSNANGEMSGYHWKKKSSTFYLNKTLKKYHRRPDLDALRRRTLKSLYRKKGKETGGNEWVCTHCDLTFDNSNLLNLHTLTHAAEDVGLDEVKRLACDPNDNKATVAAALQPQKFVSVEGNCVMNLEESDAILTLDANMLACPVCYISFHNQHDLIEHASVHGKTKRKLVLHPDRPHKCEKCWKAFGSHERLQKHLLCHGDENAKPLQCQVCYKRFMNNSALSCHMKTHSDRKYYECPLCRADFDQVTLLKSHVTQHEQPNGKYMCPSCKREFDDFVTIRKHMRAFHSEKKYPCLQCEKIFPRPDKLKLHMLRHSSHREFMCENCGRQFKRKDKLKEHIKRMHSAEREARLACKEEKPINHKKFMAKVSPNDYHRFIYKCHTCLLGFKRRGMLVNHLAKRHPEIKPETVPELNLPILKTQRDYYCQYCEKVYKSSSKRKAHILKNHPGSELPMSSRRRTSVQELPGIPNPTYSQMVGSITTMPHSCSFCHKQYASKAKLMQHQRKKHAELVPPPSLARTVKEEKIAGMSDDSQGGVGDEDYNVAAGQAQAVADPYQPADLLTQAMSELTQSLEYRPTGDYTVTRVSNTPTPSGQPTMVQIQATSLAGVPGQHTTTIELSHLGQNLVHTQFAAVNQQQGQALVAAANQDSPQPLSPSQQTNSNQATAVPVTLSANAIALARTWSNFSFR